MTVKQKTRLDAVNYIPAGIFILILSRPLLVSQNEAQHKSELVETDNGLAFIKGVNPGSFAGV